MSRIPNLHLRRKMRIGRRYLIPMAFVLVILYSSGLASSKPKPSERKAQDAAAIQQSHIDRVIEEREHSNIVAVAPVKDKANSNEQTTTTADYNRDDPKNASKLFADIKNPFGKSDTDKLTAETYFVMQAYATNHELRKNYSYLWPDKPDPAVVEPEIGQFKILAIAVGESEITGTKAAVQVAWSGTNVVGDKLYEESRVYFMQDHGNWVPIKLV